MRSVAPAQPQDLSDERALAVERELPSLGAAAETYASSLPIWPRRTVKR